MSMWKFCPQDKQYRLGFLNYSNVRFKVHICHGFDELFISDIIDFGDLLGQLGEFFII